MAGGISGSQASFAASVLKGIGAPVTSQNIAGFVGWSKAEGGDNWQRNNPLNTTEPAGSSGSINSVGVRAYPNANAGIAATVKTLQNGHYGGILGALKSNNVHGLAAAIGSSPWGTSGSLAAQTIAETLGQPIGQYSTSSSGGLPSVPGMQTISQTVPTFDQAGYNAAKTRYIAGSFLKGQSTSANPYNTKGSSLDSSPLFAKGLLTTTAPNVASYQGTKTIQTATGALQGIAGTGLTNIHAGAQGYVNPIPSAVIGRTDMGVDANLKPGAPIRAIGDSKVLGIMPNWYAGQSYLALQLTSGPKAGQNYYVAEQMTPQVRPGQTVKAGQTIATYANSGTGIEIGWAGKNWQQTLAQEQGNTGSASHANAPAGANFRSFLGGLGG